MRHRQPCRASGFWGACLDPLAFALLQAAQIYICRRRILGLAEISAIAGRHGLPVVEDAACAIGSEYKGQRVGRPYSSMACFSFHPRKVLTTGEGGMITTADEETASRLRRLRQHGMSVPDLARHGSSKVVIESYDEVGYNYRMTDLQAAIGLV
jgi:perosamine synthetase